MRILVAPDKFKGTLNARDAAQNIAKGLLDVLPDAQIEVVPMADGGEGTAEAVCDARGCSWLECKAHDPLGREIDARCGWIGQEKLAVMEMSEAAGMRRLSESERDPIRASTFGVGEMLLDATKRGANEIIIGLGGSATNDGGFGMARALGFQFFGEGENEIQSVAELPLLKRIERPKELEPPRIVAAVDVKNRLLGENGATRVFGPQKGASKSDLDNLERALTKLADVVREWTPERQAEATGIGAPSYSTRVAPTASALTIVTRSPASRPSRPGRRVANEACRRQRGDGRPHSRCAGAGRAMCRRCLAPMRFSWRQPTARSCAGLRARRARAGTMHFSARRSSFRRARCSRWARARARQEPERSPGSGSRRRA